MIPSSEKTNGQVVMESLRPVFPNVKAKKAEDYCCFGGSSHHIDLIIGNWVADFPIEWWEEPYEGVEKERYKDCFQPKSNEKLHSSQKDQVEEDAKAFQEVATAFQLGLSFGFIDGLKEDEYRYDNTSDILTVSFDSGLKDEAVLCVSRKYIGKTIVLKMELGEQADILYHLLTEQMTKAEIKPESEVEKNEET